MDLRVYVSRKTYYTTLNGEFKIKRLVITYNTSLTTIFK